MCSVDANLAMTQITNPPEVYRTNYIGSLIKTSFISLFIFIFIFIQGYKIKLRVILSPSVNEFPTF